MGEPATFDDSGLERIAAWLVDPATGEPMAREAQVIREAIAAHAALRASYDNLFNTFAEQTGIERLALGEREK